MSIKARLADDVKTAMRARDSERLGTLRLVQAAIKQREVDERIELDDTAVIAVLEKLLKQRQESITQFDAAGRTELADKERSEAALIETYLPAALDAAAVARLVDDAIAETGADSPKAMGAVMNAVRTKAGAARVDMSQVSALVKSRLSSG